MKLRYVNVLVEPVDMLEAPLPGEIGRLKVAVRTADGVGAMQVVSIHHLDDEGQILERCFYLAKLAILDYLKESV